MNEHSNTADDMNATIEQINNASAFFELTDANGDWCGAFRVGVKFPLGKGFANRTAEDTDAVCRAALFEAGFDRATTEASLRDSRLETFKWAA